MNPMSRKRKSDRGNLEPDVYCALQAIGWIPPEVEPDVESVQSELAQDDVSLPDALRDSEAVLAGDINRGSAASAPIAFAPDPETDQDMARAAREGGPIPPEIEKIMRKDRLAAERKLDGTDNGEDVR